MTDERPTHLDLFSGIGGFALAAQWAGFRTVAFCEKEEYPVRNCLNYFWPDTPVFDDIRKLDGTQFRGVDLLTGGFPCQPFSVAGLQRGAADDRALWPEMFRTIQESKPYWVIGENVAGLDGLGLDDCISDMESIGYEVAPPLEIPACAVGADHVRNRIWIVGALPANSNGVRPQRKRSVAPRAWSKQQLKGLVQDQLRVSIPAGKSGGVSDGVSRRAHRLKGLGNAIVPQVAFEIIKEIRNLIESGGD